MQQGRVVLANTLGCYKYCVVAGQAFILSGILQHYLGVVISSGLWLLMDIVFVFNVAFCVAQTKPLSKRIRSRRPTFKLLGENQRHCMAC
jgi:magnesium-transporting ATPase (P-type)